MYSFSSRVRYSETDDSGRLTIPALINYFQDCSTFHSEEVGQGMEVLREREKAWIIIYWQIEIERLPKLAEEIIVSTMATGTKGLCAKRNFLMRDKEGTLLARADSAWVLMDTTRMRPTKLTKDMIEPYKKEEPLLMEEMDRKIPLPEKMAVCPKIKVGKEHIDTNGHVNNCQYIRMAFHLLEKEVHPTKLRVEYVKSAMEGDWIIPKIAFEEERILVGLFDIQGHSYANLEIIC